MKLNESSLPHISKLVGACAAAFDLDVIVSTFASIGVKKFIVIKDGLTVLEAHPPRSPNSPLPLNNH